MNTRIIAAIGTMILLICSTGVFAQAPQPAPGANIHAGKMTPDARAEAEVAHIDGIAHLTDDQKGQVKQLLLNIENQREQNKAAANGDREAMKEMNKGLNQQRKEGMDKILTVAQHQALKQAREANRTNPQNNGQPQPGGDK